MTDGCHVAASTTAKARSSAARAVRILMTNDCKSKGHPPMATAIWNGTVLAKSYPQPKSAAAEIKDYVAFWKGVTVEA